MGNKVAGKADGVRYGGRNGKWSTETAEWYAKEYGEYATNRLAVDALDLSPDAVIVDVGCGTGAALRHAAPRVPNGNLIGIDSAPRMVEIARERKATHPHGDRISFREGLAEALPVDDAFANVVFAFDSYDHWQDKRLGLAEIRRVLKPAGQLIIVKDGGVPGAEEAPQTLLDDLGRAGFEIIKRQECKSEGVSLTMLLCAPG